MIRLLVFSALLLTQVQSAEPPRVVAVPPADGGRGLVRVSETEIRHYAGKGVKTYLRSTDNGETWSDAELPDSFPQATSMGKEAPAIGRNPNNGEFLRVEPIYRGGETEGIHVSKGGLDGTWTRIEDSDGKPILLKGILRNPLWVNDGKRVLVPGHGSGCWTWYSDDDGASWKRSNKVQAPSHQIGGVHKGVRWNHGIIEATIWRRRTGRCGCSLGRRRISIGRASRATSARLGASASRRGSGARSLCQLSTAWTTGGCC